MQGGSLSKAWSGTSGIEPWQCGWCRKVAQSSAQNGVDLGQCEKTAHGQLARAERSQCAWCLVVQAELVCGWSLGGARTAQAEHGHTRNLGESWPVRVEPATSGAQHWRRSVTAGGAMAEGAMVGERKGGEDWVVDSWVQRND